MSDGRDFARRQVTLDATRSKTGTLILAGDTIGMRSYVVIELSDELRQVVNTHPDEPIRIIDAVTKKSYVLVESDIFDRLTNFLGDDFDPRIGMAMMNVIMAEDDKDDPYLESYQPEPS